MNETKIVLSIWLFVVGIIMILSGFGIDPFNFNKNYPFVFILGGSFIILEYLNNKEVGK